MRSAQRGVRDKGISGRAEADEAKVEERDGENSKEEGEESSLRRTYTILASDHSISRDMHCRNYPSSGQTKGVRHTTGELGPTPSPFFLSPGRAFRAGFAVCDPAAGRHVMT